MTIFAQQLFLQFGKVEASGEHVAQTVTLSPQIVRAQVRAENTSLKLLVPVEVPLWYHGRGNSVLRSTQPP